MDNKSTTLLDRYRSTFRLSNSTESKANEFRRTILQSVPTLAIDTVTYFTNTSILPPDYLAHRLGLIPLKINEKKTRFDTNLIVNFTLDCTLPPDSEEVHEIYSDQLISDDDGVSARPDILLLKIKGGQSVKLQAKAVVGTGKDHAKWSPVCKAVFEEDPKNPNVFVVTIKTIGGLTPKQVFKSAVSIVRNQRNTS